MSKNKGRVLILFAFQLILLFGSFVPHSKIVALDKVLFSEEANVIQVQSTLPSDDISLFSDYSLSIEWTYELAYFRDSAPIISDLDYDGKYELLISDHNGNIHCIENNGSSRWVFADSELRGGCFISIANFDNDVYPEIIVTSSSSYVFCLDDDGSEIWRFQSNGDIGSTSAIADLNNDGNMNILFICNDGFSTLHTEGAGLFCLNSTGHIEWFYSIDTTNHYYSYSSPLIIDVDNDSQLEVILLAKSEIVCLNRFGNEEWSYFGYFDTYSSPSCADLNNDGKFEILMYGNSDPGGRLTAISYYGNDYWSCDLGEGYLDGSISVADLDNDNYPEIILGNDATYLFCVSHTGTLQWTFQAGNYEENFRCSPALTDIENDGKSEIIVFTDSLPGTGFSSSKLYILNNLGEQICEYSMATGFDAHPCQADLDNDNIPEIICVNDNGDIYCFTILGTLETTNSIWWGFQGNIARNGHMDTDGDFLDDATELHYETNSTLNDSDFDGIMDGYEIYFTNSDALNNDTDGDGLLDGFEFDNNLNLNANDSLVDDDNDGINNLEELTYHTNPNKYDTDGDGLGDGEEIFFYLTNATYWDSDYDQVGDGDEIALGMDPLVHDSAEDFDDDGLTNLEEINIGSNININDTDGDGIIDGDEVLLYQSNPLLNDTDGDGLLDFEEIFTYFTLPNSVDSDNDTLTDYQEIFTYFTDANNFDTDGDNLDDAWEVIHFLNPLVNDSSEDADGDGLTNYLEYIYNTDPWDMDSDDDGLSDGMEVNTYLTNPLLSDSDFDGITDDWEVYNGLNPNFDDSSIDYDNDLLTNFWEYYYNTQPFNNDTDGDGMPDGFETIIFMLNPLNPDDASVDFDNDGLDNLLEYQIGTNIWSKDTDGDGMPDGWEYNNNLNPLIDDSRKDYDNDDLTNLEEYTKDRNPFKWDNWELIIYWLIPVEVIILGILVFITVRVVRNKRARRRGFLSYKDAKPKREAGFHFGHLYFRAKELGFDNYNDWKRALQLGFSAFEEWQYAKNNGFYTKKEQIDFAAKGFSNYEIFVDTLKNQLNLIIRLNNQLLALIIDVATEDYSRDRDQIQDLEELKNKIMEIEPVYNLFVDLSDLSTRNYRLNKNVKLEKERSEELRRKALFFFEEKMWDVI